MNPQTYTAVVSSVTRKAGDFYVAKLALTDPKEIQFQAGQYVIFKIGPPKGNHTLSIASPPSQAGEIDILQSVTPMGEGSKWLLGLKGRDTVQFLGPLGKFTLQRDPKPKVFVATGCGIAPIRSMILDHPSGTLYWGLRHETDVFWDKELTELSHNNPDFRFTITLSQPSEGWKGARGRVTRHVVRETPRLVESGFYLCGSRQMIVDMKGILTDNGVPSEQIFTETFF